MSPPTEPGVYFARLLNRKHQPYTHFVHIFGRAPYLQVKAYNIELNTWVRSDVDLHGFDFSEKVDLRTAPSLATAVWASEKVTDFPTNQEEPVE